MRILAAAVIALTATTLFGQTVLTNGPGNEPVQPFRIVSNVYYVGAADITSYLIATPKGHIVIDGGYVETEPLIVRNIEKLGFDPHDIRSFATLRALPVDIFLGAHGSMFDLAGKMARRTKGSNPFIDPAGYKQYLDAAEKRFNEMVAAQQ